MGTTLSESTTKMMDGRRRARTHAPIIFPSNCHATPPEHDNLNAESLSRRMGEH